MSAPLTQLARTGKPAFGEMWSLAVYTKLRCLPAQAAGPLSCASTRILASASEHQAPSTPGQDRKELWNRSACDPGIGIGGMISIPTGARGRSRCSRIPLKIRSSLVIVYRAKRSDSIKISEFNSGSKRSQPSRREARWDTDHRLPYSLRAYNSA